MIRATNSTEKLGEIAPKKVPKLNIQMAKISNDLLLNFSIKKAVTGIIIPFVSINAVVTHCA